MNFSGYDVTKEPTKAKFNVGYVPDHYALYEKLTGREYINYIADIFNVTEEERNERLEEYEALRRDLDEAEGISEILQW